MTATLIDQVPASSAKPRGRAGLGAQPRREAPPTRGAPVDRRRPVHSAASACRDVAPAAGPRPSPALNAQAHSYVWTQRGLAVLLAGVALVLGVMALTAVLAFLAVSNEPVGAPVVGRPIAQGPVAGTR